MTAAGMAVAEPVLQVSGLTIAGSAGPIVSNIDLSIRAGEVIGIVGESGSGKSMTARALMGILPPGVAASGSVRYQGDELLPGRPGHRLHEDFAMVFQDPFTMLNPLMRAGRHISETMRDGRGRKLGRAAARAEEVRRLAEVGITDPSVAARYPFELSGGMRQRVGIAATLSSNPRVLLADEPTTALDVTTQAEILNLMRGLQRDRDMAMVLITHDLGVAFSMCDRIFVLYAGRLIEQAPAVQLARFPLHPYTRGLLDSDPPADYRVDALSSMPGSVPRAVAVLGQCPFADRCSFARAECRQPVSLTPVDQDRSTACIRIDEIRDRLAIPALIPASVAEVKPSAEDAADALVAVTKLGKRFTRAGRHVDALQDVSVYVRTGESVGIVGESGSGKTTLGRCIVGLETPTSGSILVDGRDATDYGSLSRSETAHLRGTVQMAFQDPYSTLSPSRSIGAVLHEAVRIGDRTGKTSGRVKELLELVGLPAGYASRMPADLSGGERQRVALARALARRPRLIVCDEIVSALDVSVQAQILNLLTRLQAELGLGYLFITHDLAVVRQVTDRIYVLRRGVIVEHGSTEQVLERPQAEYTQRLLESIPVRAHGAA
jgi:peptide/nickel transport system ATP-binding protein